MRSRVHVFIAIRKAKAPVTLAPYRNNACARLKQRRLSTLSRRDGGCYNACLG
jgi:hypothetical protein